MANENVPYGMPKITGDYLLELLEHARTNPQIAALFRATHHVLAGGQVDVRIVEPGDAAQVATLDAIVAESVKTSNAVNAAAGTYVTIS